MRWLRWGIWISIAVLPVQATSAQSAADLAAQARTAQESGDYLTAEKSYRDALKLDSKSVALWNSLGVMLNREERYEDAAAAFRSALQRAPSIEGLQLNLGIALFRAAKLSEAAEVFERLPNQEQARELLAMSYAGLELFDRAVPLLEALVPQNTDPTLHLALANCYERLGRKADVERVIARMFQVVPDSAPLHVALAEAYNRDSNLEGAVAEYGKAAALDPKMPGIRLSLGRLLWKVRRFDEAEPQLEAELKINPGNADAKYYLASIYLYRNETRRAIPLLQDFVHVRPNEKNGFFELGRALLKENRNPEAVAALRRAADLGPSEPNLHYQLAQAYRLVGKSAEAEREFEISKRLRAAQLQEFNQRFQSETSKN